MTTPEAVSPEPVFRKYQRPDPPVEPTVSTVLVTVQITPPVEPGNLYSAFARHTPTGMEVRRWGPTEHVAQRYAVAALMALVQADAEEA